MSLDDDDDDDDDDEVFITIWLPLTEIGGYVLTWPSRPRNNDDTTSCQHVYMFTSAAVV